MFHIFKNQLIITLRRKSLIFWTLIFPIILGTFFSLAFSNLYSEELFDPIDIAVIDNDFYKNSSFKQVIDSISNGDENILNVILTSELEAKKLLADNKIKGYYFINDKVNVVIDENGINQTIIKQIADNYYQTYSVASNLNKYNKNIIPNINENNKFFSDISNKNVDFTVVYFYSLIGMVCLYAGFFGLNSVLETEANLSKRAARLSIAPTHKLKNLFATLLPGLVIVYIEFTIIMLYLVFILNVEFGNQLSQIMFLGFVGSLAGITLGTFIGVSNKLNDNLKSSILIAVCMTCSFLSGMMMWQMKYIINENMPIINKINPVSMITDALYSLYYYTNLDKYYYNIISLILFSFVMILLSYLFLRRKKYDSI